ncbi:MAG: hypothetical protein RI990_633 [Planctomycetota bacterium]
MQQSHLATGHARLNDPHATPDAGCGVRIAPLAVAVAIGMAAASVAAVHGHAVGIGIAEPAAHRSSDASHGPWRHRETLRPRPIRDRAYGAAIAASAGSLWIGPGRDTDIGDGPATVTVLGPFIPPTPPTTTLEHPEGDRSAGFGLALAAAPGIGVAGSPHAGCSRRACDSGQAHLVLTEDDGSTVLVEVPCPDAAPAAEFGAAVATDGRTVVVASPRADAAGLHDSGAVDVFRVSGTRSSRRAVHVARLISPEPTVSARFGAAVAVDGDWLAIGEPGAGHGTPRPGAVHMYARTATGWALHESLRASAGAVGWHGASVALAGANLLVGAPFALADGGADPGSGRPRTGTAQWYALIDGTWSRQRTFGPGDVAADGTGFGMAVALHGPWAAVGAPGLDAAGEDSGAVWVIHLETGRSQRLAAPHGAPGDGLGAGLAFLAPRERGASLTLAASMSPDPERPPVPGQVELFTLPAPQPSRSASHDASASTMAAAPEASVTPGGIHPEATIRASASAP